MSVEICGELIQHILSSKRLNETQRKELLISYLPRIFPNSVEIASAFAVGAETYVKTKKSTESQANRGFIDTLLGQVVLEFKENLSLAAKRKEAELELKRYVSSLWNDKGTTSSFACVATDVLAWNIYRPTPIEPAEKKTYSSDDVYLELVETVKISSSDESDSSLLYQLLNKIIIEQYVKFLNSESLNVYFGFESVEFKSFHSVLGNVLSEAVKSDSEISLAMELWSQQQEYNALEVSGFEIELYCKHLYLVLLSRMIVAIHLIPERKKFDDAFLKTILNGKLFEKHKILNFVERDYFYWINFERFSQDVLPVIRNLYHSLISFRVEESENENILNDVYNELLPEDQKAFWGQKSTPITLTTKIIDSVGNVSESRVLDPACGGGNFIKAFFKKIKNETNPDKKEELVRKSFNITGIDVDPVSVCISKSVWLLQTYDFLNEFKKHFSIPIYHADSLFILANSSFKGKPHFIFDGVKISIPDVVLVSPEMMDSFVSWCQQVAYEFSKLNEKKISIDSGQITKMASAHQTLKGIDFNDAEVVTCAKILISELWERIVSKRNGIWSFILRNSYRPTFLGGHFDVIVSNPPWLTMSSFANIPYKKYLESRSLDFGIKPKGSAFLHTEIATVFLTHCMAYYLRDGGKAVCVLPRSVFNGDHHDSFRRNAYLKKVHFNISKVWDMEDVSGLFKIPSFVLFAQKNTNLKKQSYPIEAVKLKGEIPLLEEGDKYSLSLNIIDKKSSWGPETQTIETNSTAYKDGFRQGADLMPRTVCFVDIFDGSKSDDILSVKTSQIEIDNKNNKVLKGVSVEGHVRRDFLFYTLTSNYLLPFLIIKPLPLVVLPVTINNSNSFEISESEELVERGYFETNSWFTEVDELLRNDSKENFRKRANTRNKLTLQQRYNSGFLVHYGAGGKNPAAALLNVAEFTDFNFVADQTTYFFHTENENEAHYLIGVLNSTTISKVIKSYQSKGDFGERHIHKLPLQFVPPFEPNNSIHTEISKFSMQFSKQLNLLEDERVSDVSKTIASRRSYFRKLFTDKFSELDSIVENLFNLS